MTRQTGGGRFGRLARAVTDYVTDRLLRRVVWQASERHNLAGRAGEQYPLVLIIGREHYSERHKLYPALRRRDLEKVLRGELADEPPTIRVIDPIRDDRRRVSFYRLDPEIVGSLPRSLFVVPESVLLATQLLTSSWADVERQGFRYFLFQDGPSQPAGGVLEARPLVAMAAGVDPDEAPEDWRGSDEMIGRLRRTLSALPVSTWWACRNPVPRTIRIADLAWKPMAVTAGVMLFVYLAFSSAYLQASLGQRDGALEKLGPEVQQGLVADNEARDLASRRDALIELWNGRADTQQLWLGVASTLSKGANISRIDMQNGRISLRGESPDAAEVLLALASLPEFEDVDFDAPVRTGRNGRQTFVLSFTLSGHVANAEPVNE